MRRAEAAGPRVLFATAEMHPLAKTGGLADVSAALPAALAAQGVDVTVTMPAYRGVLDRVRTPRTIARLDVRRQAFELVAARHPASDVPLLLVANHDLYGRDGDPYRNGYGQTYGDNAWRFGSFGDVVARIAAGEVAAVPAGDVVHLNDWQTGLAAAHLRQRAARLRIVFSIHNLAYQGCFGRAEFDALGLPPAWWTPAGVEYWGGFNCMKAGLVHADVLTTVSPTYAREIQTPEVGAGLDGVLRARSDALHGILNGIDVDEWNPARDAHLVQTYDVRTVAAGKAANRRALQAQLQLAAVDRPLLVFVGRLAAQKGADALLAALPELLRWPLQVAVLAAGDAALEAALRALAARHPDRLAVHLDYDERLAHRFTAAADLLVMPSRYEPCGLNQLYAQRYGTVPLVRRVGGLADTVVDVDAGGFGVQFEDTDRGGVLYAVRRGLELLAQPGVLARRQAQAMARDFSWRAAAQRYVALYRPSHTEPAPQRAALPVRGAMRHPASHAGAPAPARTRTG